MLQQKQHFTLAKCTWKTHPLLEYLQLPDGQTLALPRVVTAQFGSDPSKYTVCVYGHVDVQPAKLEDGWKTDPYNLTDINGEQKKLSRKNR